MKIAVIEDEAPIRDMYKLKLENNGFVVAAAEDGQQGLEIIKRHQPLARRIQGFYRS